MEQDTFNRDWSFGTNLSGIQPALGKPPNVPEGFYKGKVTDMYVNPEKPGRVVIKLSISEGEFAGVVRTTGLNVPTSDEDKVRHYWRAMAESVGYTPSDLDKGAININQGAFLNRVAHFHYVPKEETADKQGDDLNFLPPIEWNQRRQTFIATAGQRAQLKATAGAGGGSALGSSGGAAKQAGSLGSVQQGSSSLGAGSAPAMLTPGDNGTTSKDEVLSRLGLGGIGGQGGGTLGT